MNKILTLIGTLLITYVSLAQSDMLNTNYASNVYLISPATTYNFNSDLSASFFARKQWTGFKGAPGAQLVAFRKNEEKIAGAYGAVIYNDRQGHENILNFKANYAYHMRVGTGAHLQFGLSAGFVNKSLKGSELIYDDFNDDYAHVTDISRTTVDFSFGATYIASNYSVGFASTHLTRSIKNADFFKLTRHYYLFGTYTYEYNEKLDFIPNVLIKNSGVTTQFNIGTMVSYLKKYEAGLAFRSSEAISVLVGMKVHENIRVNYSYDISVGPIHSYSSGSHEILIRYNISTSHQNSLL